jgi:hypothetical protein
LKLLLRAPGEVIGPGQRDLFVTGTALPRWVGRHR